jgi:hypothetical protein
LARSRIDSPNQAGFIPYMNVIIKKKIVQRYKNTLENKTKKINVLKIFESLNYLKKNTKKFWIKIINLLSLMIIK